VEGELKMKRLITLLLILSAGSVFALEPQYWDICLQYKFQSANDAWKVDKDKNGKIFIYDWKLADAIPSESDLEKVKDQALVWWQDKQKTQKADFENWDNKEFKALAKVLVDEINALRAKDGLQPRTTDQLKAAIKAQM
jgi:hypothetical protein